MQGPPECGIHLDYHSSRSTPRCGNGGVLKDRAESRLCILTCGKFRSRKWDCGIHSATVARDGSRKKARDGLSDTLVFPTWERPTGQAIDLFLFRFHYRRANLRLRRADVTSIQETPVENLGNIIGFSDLQPE